MYNSTNFRQEGKVMKDEFQAVSNIFHQEQLAQLQEQRDRANAEMDAELDKYKKQRKCANK